MTRRTQTLSKTEILYTEKLGDYGCNAYIFVIHYSFLESIQGITVEVYSQEMDEMHIRLSKMKPALVIDAVQFWSVHVAMMIFQRLTNLKYKTLPFSSYLLDL